MRQLFIIPKNMFAPRALARFLLLIALNLFVIIGYLEISIALLLQRPENP
jgi:hypothetical protein